MPSVTTAAERLTLVAEHGGLSSSRIATLQVPAGRRGLVMPWARMFDDPIWPPKGKPLLTLKDAAR